MQFLIITFITFIVVLLLIYIFFKSKQNRLMLLLGGTCPACGEKRSSFKDEKTNTNFTYEVISQKLLRNHGCQGLSEVEFTCKSCDLKEVHSISNLGNCGL